MTAQAVAEPVRNKPDEAPPSQFLTFLLGEECYGVDILRVREIRGFTPVTPVPNVPPFVRGVLNLRGTVIPVIDLRLRLGMPAAEDSRFRVIVVAAVNSSGGPGGPASKVAGLLVDAVSEVAEFSAAEMCEPPDLGGRPDTAFVKSIVTSGGKLVVLIDLEPLWAEAPAGGPQE